jgi:hypothetical protein
MTSCDPSALVPEARMRVRNLGTLQGTHSSPWCSLCAWPSSCIYCEIFSSQVAAGRVLVVALFGGYLCSGWQGCDVPLRSPSLSPCRIHSLARLVWGCWSAALRGGWEQNDRGSILGLTRGREEVMEVRGLLCVMPFLTSGSKWCTGMRATEEIFPMPLLDWR